MRLDVINPQTINEAGNAGYLDLTTGEIKVAGVGGTSLNGDIENKLNWAPRVGATYQFNEKTVIRGGYGRSYDMGVFGSLFGHSVTQNLPVLSVQAGGTKTGYSMRYSICSSRRRRLFFSTADSGRFPLPNNVFARALPTEQRPPAVDAFNVIVQRQLTTPCRWKPATSATGAKGYSRATGPGSISTRRPSTAICRASRSDQRQPFFNKFGWTQGIDYFCNCAKSEYDSLQAKFNKRFAGGYSVKANYTLQRALTHDAQYFETDLPEHQGLYDSDLNYGPAGWDRKHNAVLSLVAELPIGRNRHYLSDISPAMDAIIGGWQFNVNHIMQSGLPFDVTYRDAGADRDTGAEPCRPDRRPFRP